MTVPTIETAGDWLRVVDPEWTDPLDASHAAERGRRWNPPAARRREAGRESIATLYLNVDRATAQANARRRFEGLPYGVENLDPDTGPVLVTVELPSGDASDLRSSEGLEAVDLPSTYPRYADGTEVSWEECQVVGERLFDEGSDGVACRSAALVGGEELAWFTRGRRAGLRQTERFADWYWS